MSYLDTFTLAYLECAYWADLRDDEGESIDDQYDLDDLAPESFLTALHTCAEFVWANLGSLYEITRLKGGDRNEDEAAAQCGHDLWLTRNHHGAGFWDRGYGAVGDDLTRAAHPYGEGYLYVGDDGRVYLDN